MERVRLLLQRALVIRSKVFSRMPFYAVQLGKKPGVYKTWSECQEQTTGFKGARFKKFDTEEEASEFVKGNAASGKPAADKKDKDVKKPAAREKKSASRSSDEELEEDSKKTRAATSSKDGGPSRKRSLAKDSSDEEKDSDPESKRKKDDDEEDDPDAITVFTDGCCINNGKGNPHGGVGVYWGPDHPNNLSVKLEGRQTNNRAEIYAAIHAIRQAKGLGIKKLIIKTDSSFLINCQTNWVTKWKKNGWKTSAGADVTNKEELMELDEEEKDFAVKYVHVPGHKGVEGNEGADKLAKAGAKK